MTEQDTDVLISRILDRQAEPQDFDAFSAAAEAEPEAWKELLGALRDDVALGVATDARLDAATQVEAPIIELRAPRALPVWTGWAAALLLAVAWLGWNGQVGIDAGLGKGGDVAGGPTGPLTAEPVSAGMFGSDGPRLRDGAIVPAADHVLGELPPELISARPAVEGEGVEVVYVRRVLERARVDSAWSVGTDELGRPAPVRVNLELLVGSDVN
ncbi:MAG: hypothetical protein ACYTCU_03265 [Planctomycetota bacterium]|jgi:hypothetical protein